MGSVNQTLSENSILKKKHDTSMVEGDGIMEQINFRMMKLHFEMIYNNLDQNQDRINDFSFEIDNMNHLIIPSNQDKLSKNFVQLPSQNDLYKEISSSRDLKWEVDRNTIRIVPHDKKSNKS